jgi:hypothetical protein
LITTMVFGTTKNMTFKNPNECDIISHCWDKTTLEPTKNCLGKARSPCDFGVEGPLYLVNKSCPQSKQTHGPGCVSATFYAFIIIIIIFYRYLCFYYLGGCKRTISEWAQSRKFATPYVNYFLIKISINKLNTTNF